MQKLDLQPLTAEAFAPFGTVMDIRRHRKTHESNGGTTGTVFHGACPLADTEGGGGLHHFPVGCFRGQTRGRRFTRQ